MTIITRTPQQVFKRWIKALRSGTYRQGQGALKGLDGSFCCLGVACDLAVKDGGTPWKATVKPSAKRAYGINGQVNFLPRQMREFLGISKQEQVNLINLNDNKLASFDRIADTIEFTIMPSALARLKKRAARSAQ